MENYQKEALLIAKKSILESFGKSSLEDYMVINNELKKNLACFVTLKKQKNQLRGCIGNIIGFRELYKSIIENAKSAAFGDPRFPSLNEDELENLIIEITILGALENKKFDSMHQLFNYLKENKPGLVVKLGNKQATFLPSVWKEIPNEKNFLYKLLYKAGINIEDFLKNLKKTEFQTYTGEDFSDNFNNI